MILCWEENKLRTKIVMAYKIITVLERENSMGLK